MFAWFVKAATQGIVVALSLVFSASSAFAQAPPGPLADRICMSGERVGMVTSDWQVNGHDLNQAELQNLAWIKKCVLPFLPGSLDLRATLLSEVTWWSLREGVLEFEAEKLFAYSNCHFKIGGDRDMSDEPLFECGTNIWQVGVMASQAMNYSLAEIEQQGQLIREELGDSYTQEFFLEWTAQLAGYDGQSDVVQKILSASPRVQRSWWARNPLIGALLTRPEVEIECLKEDQRWCYQGRYPEALKFGANRAVMLQSIADLKAYFLRGEMVSKFF